MVGKNYLSRQPDIVNYNFDNSSYNITPKRAILLIVINFNISIKTI